MSTKEELLNDFNEEKLSEQFLLDADPNCVHNIVALWSGVKCSKCTGWLCY